METADLLAHLFGGVVRLSVGDVDHRDTAGCGRETTTLAEKDVACTLGRSSSVCVSTTVLDGFDLLALRKCYRSNQSRIRY